MLEDDALHGRHVLSVYPVLPRRSTEILQQYIHKYVERERERERVSRRSVVIPSDLLIDALCCTVPVYLTLSLLFLRRLAGWSTRDSWPPTHPSSRREPTTARANDANRTLCKNSGDVCRASLGSTVFNKIVLSCYEKATQKLNNNIYKLPCGIL